MTEIKKRAFAGVVGLVAAGLFSVGCSSSSTATPGTGGTTGTAGATGHGGTTGTGTGGSGTGTGGTAGTGPGCHMSDVPASATIADFSSADGGIAAMDGVSTYGGTLTKPSYTIAGGTLTITDQVVPASMPQYVGLVIYFNGNAAGTDCVDASAYTGIQFDISGTLMGPSCSIQYSTNDSEHSDSTLLNATGGPNDPKAAGPAGSYSLQLPIPSISSTPTTTMVPFADSALNPGSPALPIDKTKITGVQWQLTVPAASDGGPTECDLALTIDNVKFYP